MPGRGFYPEGIAVSQTGALYAGSLPTGAIVRFRPGAVTPDNFAQLGAVAGIFADDARNLLIACNNALDFSPPSLAVLALDTGELLTEHRFPGGFGFCNDLTLDGAGNVYATDSLQQVIVRVPAGALSSSDEATVWASSPEFETPPNQFGLNGILYDGTGHLFAGNYTTGTLHRIAIEPNGDAGAIQNIELGRPLAGLDGFERIDATTFLASEQYAGALSEIRLASATSTTGEIFPVANGLDTPTTFALFDRSAWIIEGQLDHFLGYDPAPPSLPFKIVRVPLDYSLPIGPSQLAGHWTSSTCEPLPAGSGPAAISRDFAINDSEWSLWLTFYSDAACTAPAFASDIIGPYRLGALSSAAGGATEADFGYRSIRFTAYDLASAALFEDAGCGALPWGIGVTQEVGDTGCIGVAPKITDCPFDHDLVKIENDRLYFGARGGADMCLSENRPQRLNPLPVVRR